MYITFDDYMQLYETIDEKLFNRLAFDACRYLDKYTTGIDGVKKLKASFPVDEDSVSAVKRCAATIVDLLRQIREAEETAAASNGFSETENGIHGKVIASISAGNESITYATKSSIATVIDNAVSDRQYRENLIRATIRDYLSGLQDANGVNLLYMGVYPHV